MPSYDTGFQVLMEDKQIYPGDTYFKDILKEDDSEWESTQGATYRVLDGNMREVARGDLEASIDYLALQLRLRDTSDWKQGMKYRLLVQIWDTATEYSDTVLEVNFKVR